VSLIAECRCTGSRGPPPRAPCRRRRRTPLQPGSEEGEEEEEEEGAAALAAAAALKSLPGDIKSNAGLAEPQPLCSQPPVTS